jgi:predicted SnoaL-like aldol condensation-catalyzing enzyme
LTIVAPADLELGETRTTGKETTMKLRIPLCAIALLALPAAPVLASDAQEEANKKIVLDFYDKAINQKDFAAASVHLGDKYVQHNPLAADGPEGLKAFLEFAKQNLASYRTEFKRVFADGDYVIVHAHARARPDDPTDRGTAVMDIFRLENGKVVEHWDVAQPVPEKAMNTNTMF